MARTVDAERHRARRLLILDAAVTCFAARGFERTTTAQVCAEAGIGSGTLFHYFPTKASLMTALLEEDTREVQAFFAAHRDRPAWDALDAWVDRAVEEAADPRVPGLVNAMIGAATLPLVADAVGDNAEVTNDGITALVRRGQREGVVRTDLAATRIASWVALLVDGFYGRIASDEGFRSEDEAVVLRGTVAALLSG
jgi:AcrR family transcriptional regulator